MTVATGPTTLLRRLAPGLLLMAGVVLLFRDTAAAMVAIWLRSDTFAHAFLVPPIVAWLVWRKRAALAALPTSPEPWMLLPAALLCFVWLLSEGAGVRAGTQFALVALLVLSVPAVFGRRVARELAFPLLFAFFAVPVGEFLVPVMIEATANFTVFAVRLSGVPVFREGPQFVIPSGSWSVVEACSGVRYLIASFMVGTLFAYLNFHTLRKRVAFVAVSLAVPVLANWLRAYLIVMIGHLSSNRLAVGVDHVIYGWVFFGVVIGLMFFVGARWAEPAPPPVAVAAPAPAARIGRGSWWVGLGMVALMLGVQAIDSVVLRPDTRPLAAPALPAAPAGWTAEAGLLAGWQPGFKNMRGSAAQVYTAGPARVGVWLGYYRDQGEEHKLVTSSNRLADGDAAARWTQVRDGETTLALAAATQTLRSAELRGSAVPGTTAPRLRVWQVYWVGGRFIAGDTAATLAIAFQRLLGGGDDAAVLLLSTPMDSEGGDAATAAADAVLARFAAAQWPAFAAALEAVRHPH